MAITDDLIKAVTVVADAPLNGVISIATGLFVATDKAREKYGTDLGDESVPEALREFLDWIIEAASEHVDISLGAFGIE